LGILSKILLLKQPQKKDPIELNRLREMEEEVAQELGIRSNTLRRMLNKVEEYGESHRAQGLPDDLLNILKDDLDCIESCTAKVHHA